MPVIDLFERQSMILNSNGYAQEVIVFRFSIDFLL